MAIDFHTLDHTEMLPQQEEEPTPEPQIEVLEDDGKYGKFAVEPLEQGHGVTLGNPMRRILYSSLQGTAISWVKIEGVLHEYTTIEHIQEEVSEILLNIKGVRLRSEVDRPGKLRLEVAGEGEVCAGDIGASSDFEVVNPEHHIATLSSNEARISVELNVERGKGYVAARHGDGLPIGVLPIDAVFTPIRKVNYAVERTRVGQRTDFERLVFEVWTDGSISPVEAVRQASNTLVEGFFMFANVQKGTEEGSESTIIALKISPEDYNVPVERLELSSRTLNCLKRADIDKVGQVLEMKQEDLLQIRNFGEKSLVELYDRLRERDLLPPEIDPNNQPEVSLEDVSVDDAPVDVEQEVHAGSAES